MGHLTAVVVGACVVVSAPSAARHQRGQGVPVRAAYPAAQPLTDRQENGVPDSSGTCLWSGEGSIGLEHQESPTFGSTVTV